MSFGEGTKNSARYVPVSSRITKDHSAISPSMNDQWSGKTFFISTRTPRGAVEPVVKPPADAAQRAGDLDRVVAHPRSQKLGPTGCVKSLAATR